MSELSAEQQRAAHQARRKAAEDRLCPDTELPRYERQSRIKLAVFQLTGSHLPGDEVDAVNWLEEAVRSLDSQANIGPADKRLLGATAFPRYQPVSRAA